MLTWEEIGTDLGESWENDFSKNRQKNKTSCTWQEAVE